MNWTKKRVEKLGLIRQVYMTRKEPVIYYHSKALAVFNAGMVLQFVDEEETWHVNSSQSINKKASRIQPRVSKCAVLFELMRRRVRGLISETSDIRQPATSKL